MYQNMCFTNLVFSMRSLRGRFVATIFVIRFFPQKLFGKIDWKIGWKICWKICLENLLEMLDGKFGWKIWMENWLENLLEKMLEKYVGNVGWKCWLKIWLEKCWLMVVKLLGKNRGNEPTPKATHYSNHLYNASFQLNSFNDMILEYLV